jgi:transposase
MVGMKWITRVPLSIKEAQNKICAVEDSAWEENQIKGYKIAALSSEYANIKQRWLVIESEIRKQAAIKKITEQVEKKLKSAQASLRQLSGARVCLYCRCRNGNKRLSDSGNYSTSGCYEVQ